jgi:general secretion pathway protein M
MTADAWLHGRRGQILALGMACLALMLLWLGLVDPVWSWYDDQAHTLEQRQTLLQHMQHVADTLPDLQAAAAKHGTGSIDESLMLPGNTDALAAAALQERLQAMAATAGASLTAVETLPATVAVPWHKVGLRISLSAPWPVMINLLRSIQQAPTRVFVDDLHFRSTPSANPSGALPVQISLVVYGFRSDSVR